MPTPAPMFFLKSAPALLNFVAPSALRPAAFRHSGQQMTTGDKCHWT